MVESVKKYTKAAAVLVLGATIMGTSACGAPSASSTPTSTTQTAGSTPSASTEAQSAQVVTETKSTVAPEIEAERKANEKMRKESQDLLKINGIVVTDKIIKSPHGDYPQVAVAKEGKYAKFDPSKHTGGLPKGWTKKDASEAQAFGMNFMLQEVVDSSVTGSGDDIDAEYESWKERNAGTFHPEVKSEFLSEPVDVNVIDYSWQNAPEFKEANYSYPYDGVTPRVKAVNMILTGSQEFRDGIHYKYSGTVSMNGQSTKNKNILETVSIDLSYTVLKIDGKYVIAGIGNHFSIDTGTILAQMKAKKS